MPNSVAITNTDHTADGLKALVRKCKDKNQSRRLRAIARVIEGEHTRAEIARQACVDRQTLCDWVNRYNARGADGLKDIQRSGRPPKLDPEQRAEVGRWMQEGPAAGVPSWTIGLVRERTAEVFKVALSMESIRTLMHSLGFRKLSPRPIHPKADPQKQEDFRKNFKTLVASALPEGVDLASVHLCFQDEARIGQKGMPARVWAQRGTRPRVPRDHRYGYCYLFSAIFPEAGVAVGHICDRANTDEMNRHLLDIAAKVPDDRHAPVVLDGAGWHRSKALEIPANVTLLRLPPYSPELNPVETVFQFPKSRHFANQVFETADAVVGAIWRLFGQSVKN